MVDWTTIIISIMSAGIVAIITPFLTHKFNLRRLKEEHRNKIQYMKEEWKFNWKIKSFEKFSERLNEKIKFYERLIKKLQFEKENEEREIIEMLNREFLYKKTEESDFYIFSKFNKEILNLSVKISTTEGMIAIKIKEYIKNKDKDILYMCSADVSDLKMWRNRLLEEMSNQII